MSRDTLTYISRPRNLTISVPTTWFYRTWRKFAVVSIETGRTLAGANTGFHYERTSTVLTINIITWVELAVRTGKTGRAGALTVAIFILSDTSVLTDYTTFGFITNLSGPTGIARTLEILTGTLRCDTGAVLAGIRVTGIVITCPNGLNSSLTALKCINIESFSRATTYFS